MEHWRVILLRQNASELLVFQTVSGLNLPLVDMAATIYEALGIPRTGAWLNPSTLK